LGVEQGEHGVPPDDFGQDRLAFFGQDAPAQLTVVEVLGAGG